jgi:hypothetical protein
MRQAAQGREDFETTGDCSLCGRGHQLTLDIGGRQPPVVAE